MDAGAQAIKVFVASRSPDTALHAAVGFATVLRELLEGYPAMLRVSIGSDWVNRGKASGQANRVLLSAWPQPGLNHRMAQLAPDRRISPEPGQEPGWSQVTA